MHWNAGGWFGTLGGVTLWMALLGGAMLSIDPGLGVLILGWTAIPAVLGVVLWRWRKTIAPFLAVQLLVAVAGIAALAIFVSVDVRGHRDFLLRDEFNPTDHVYPWLVVYPALMLMLWLQLRAARRRGGGEA